MTEETYIPTATGNTGQVYTKKQLARKKAREAAFKKKLEAWQKKPDQQVKCLTSVGGVHQGHPKEKPYGGAKDQVIKVKKADAEMLVKAGLAEEVK